MYTSKKENIWYKIIHYGLEYIGKYYSSYRGFVIDNVDPKGCNRLLIHVPHLDPKNQIHVWAWPKSTWGSKNYGVQCLPQPGDMIWVEFEYGNPQYPIWDYGSYAKGEIPEEFKTAKHFGFKTPSGSILVINDNKGEEEILVKHKNKLEWIKITAGEIEKEAKLIKLGKRGDEQAVLGNTLKKRMDEIMVKLDETYQLLITHTHPSNSGPTGPPIQAQQLLNIKEAMNHIKSQFFHYLSNKVKLDK